MSCARLGAGARELWAVKVGRVEFEMAAWPVPRGRGPRGRRLRCRQGWQKRHTHAMAPVQGRVGRRAPPGGHRLLTACLWPLASAAPTTSGSAGRPGAVCTAAAGQRHRTWPCRRVQPAPGTGRGGCGLQQHRGPARSTRHWQSVAREPRCWVPARAQAQVQKAIASAGGAQGGVGLDAVDRCASGCPRPRRPPTAPAGGPVAVAARRRWATTCWMDRCARSTTEPGFVCRSRVSSPVRLWAGSGVMPVHCGHRPRPNKAHQFSSGAEALQRGPAPSSPHLEGRKFGGKFTMMLRGKFTTKRAALSCPIAQHRSVRLLR